MLLLVHFLVAVILIVILTIAFFMVSRATVKRLSSAFWGSSRMCKVLAATDGQRLKKVSSLMKLIMIFCTITGVDIEPAQRGDGLRKLGGDGFKAMAELIELLTALFESFGVATNRSASVCIW